MEDHDDFDQYMQEREDFENAGGPGFLEEMAIVKFATYEAYVGAGFSDKQALYLVALEELMVEPPDPEEY